MKVGAFKKLLKNVPDEFDVEIFDNEAGEWKTSLDGYLQIVHVVNSDDEE